MFQCLKPLSNDRFQKAKAFLDKVTRTDREDGLFQCLKPLSNDRFQKAKAFLDKVTRTDREHPLC